LLIDLQERLNLTYLFIAHDSRWSASSPIGIVGALSRQVMEVADLHGALCHALHPYTAVTHFGVPIPDVAVERVRRVHLLQGGAASALDPPSGCRFEPAARCAGHLRAPERRRSSSIVHSNGPACHFAGQTDPAQRYAS